MENNNVESNGIKAIYDLYNLGFSTTEISQMINNLSDVVDTETLISQLL